MKQKFYINDLCIIQISFQNHAPGMKKKTESSKIQIMYNNYLLFNEI